MNILITGAAGNLGGMLARYLLDHSGACLHLLVHKKDLPDEIANHPRVAVFRGDLAVKETLHPCLKGVDCVVHLQASYSRITLNGFFPKPTRNISEICAKQPFKMELSALS